MLPRGRLLLAWTAIGLCGACAPAARASWRTLPPAELFLPGVVSTAASEVRIAFSPDGRLMLWGTIGRDGGPGGWEIFCSERGAGGWSAPRAASFCSPANDFDPAFAPDGSGVYFFSNRPGGLGGDDVWFAPCAPDGSFAAAVNLGPAVNSAGDEWAPALSPDGRRLLFASDGRGGLGRHDLFICERDAGGWGEARNVPALNTAREDFDATFLADGRSVVLSSGDLDGEVRLYVVPFRDGRWRARRLLGPGVNPGGEGGWAFGPAVSPAEPGVLYFTARRDSGAGRMDIYRIAFHAR